MRIRKSASRVLGSAYYNAQAQPEAAPPTQPPPPAPSAYGAASGGRRAEAASEGVCRLNRAPWELRSELDVPNPQEDLENYFRCATSRLGSELSSVLVLNKDQEDETVEGESKIEKKAMNKQNVAKKMNQDGEKRAVNMKARKELEKGKAKAKVEETMHEKEEEAGDSEQANVWYCKKNDGKRWHCNNIVKMNSTLCDYHFAQSRSYYTPVGRVTAVAVASGSTTSASSKPAAPAKASASSKPAPASAASSNKAASSVARAPTISKHSKKDKKKKKKKKKKASTGSGQGYIDIYAEYAFYTPWGPFRRKERGNGSSAKKDIEGSTADLREERSPEDKAAATAEARAEKNDDDVESDLLDIVGEIAGGDEGSDEDYDVASDNAVGRSRKGGISVEKAKPKKRKRTRSRSIRSLL